MQKTSGKSNRCLRILKKKGLAMAIIHYDPWQDRFKLPFGAVLIESIAHLNIDVIAEKVLHVYLVIHKDGEEIQYHEMTNQQGTFYSCDYFFNFGTGLYYYHFEIETIENKQDRKSTHLNSSPVSISYAVCCV